MRQTYLKTTLSCFSRAKDVTCKGRAYENLYARLETKEGEKEYTD